MRKTKGISEGQTQGRYAKTLVGESGKFTRSLGNRTQLRVNAYSKKSTQNSIITSSPQPSLINITQHACLKFSTFGAHGVVKYFYYLISPAAQISQNRTDMQIHLENNVETPILSLSYKDISAHKTYICNYCKG